MYRRVDPSGLTEKDFDRIRELEDPDFMTKKVKKAQQARAKRLREQQKKINTPSDVMDEDRVLFWVWGKINPRYSKFINKAALCSYLRTHPEICEAFGLHPQEYRRVINTMITERHGMLSFDEFDVLLTEGQRWTNAMARARDPAYLAQIMQQNQQEVNFNLANQAGSALDNPGVQRLKLGERKCLLEPGMMSLLGEKFFDNKKGLQNLCNVKDLIKDLSKIPLYASSLNAPAVRVSGQGSDLTLQQVFKEVESKGQNLTEIEGMISWPLFIGFFSSESAHRVMPDYSNKQRVYQRAISKAPLDYDLEAIEESLNRIFKNYSGGVSKTVLFESLKNDPSIIQNSTTDLVGETHPVRKGLTLESLIQRFEEQAPSVIPEQLFRDSIKKMILEYYSENKLEEKSEDLSPASKAAKAPTIPWETTENLFPRSFHTVNIPENLTSVPGSTIYNPSQPATTQEIGGKPSSIVNSNLEAFPRSAVPLLDKNDRFDLEDSLKASQKELLEKQLAEDHRAFLIEQKRLEEEAIQRNKDLMYEELKEKYGQKLKDKQAGGRKVSEKEIKAKKREEDRRRKMEGLLKLGQGVGGSRFEDTLSDQDKVLLREARLLRKMGKI